jgi:hypothetical protein
LISWYQRLLANATLYRYNDAVAHSAKTSSATASGDQLATAVAGSSYVTTNFDRLDKIYEVGRL